MKRKRNSRKVVVVAYTPTVASSTCGQSCNHSSQIVK